MVVFWPISVCKSSTHTTYIAQHHRICVIKAPKFTSCPPNIFCVFRNVVARRPGSEETPTPPRVVMQRQKQLISESVTHLRCPRILNARTRVRRAGHIGPCENIHKKVSVDLAEEEGGEKRSRDSEKPCGCLDRLHIGWVSCPPLDQRWESLVHASVGVPLVGSHLLVVVQARAPWMLELRYSRAKSCLVFDAVL